MSDPAAFDDLHRETRPRLLAQTYALAGEVDVARGAVDDAFAEAWAHRHRLGGDPESWVRRRAWRRVAGTRRPRRWYRAPRAQPGLDEAGRRALAALAGLDERSLRTLVLVGLSPLSLPAVGREVDLSPREVTETLERALAAAGPDPGEPGEGGVGAARPAPERARALLEPLLGASTHPAPDEHPASRSTARAARRAGARHRRRRGLAASAGAAALVVAGTVAVDVSTDGSLVEEATHGARDLLPSLGTGTWGDPAGPRGRPDDPGPSGQDPLPVASLLGTGQVAAQVPGRSWRLAGAGSEEADGQDPGAQAVGEQAALPCQQRARADPQARAEMTRVLRADPPRGATGAAARVAPRLVQRTERSATPGAARRAFRRLVGWVGGCAQPRVQLVVTRRVAGVGAESSQVVLTDWGSPARTHVVQVSRTGTITTTTAVTTGGLSPPPPVDLARLQALAVRGVCGLDGGGRCVGTLRLRASEPPPVGAVPALLSGVDLPPVSGVQRGWVGTDPVRARSNAAATRCDRASFAGRFRGVRWQRNLTRTFLVPQATLPPEFGLTQTIGTLPARTARAFTEQVRTRTARCEDRDPGTTVTPVARRDTGSTSLSVWRVRTAVTERRTIRFFTALLRRGGTVAQLAFVPTQGATMGQDAFTALARRALSRLDDRAPGASAAASRA